MSLSPPALPTRRRLRALAIALACPAQTDIYKCAGEKHAIVDQDTPCAEGRELRTLETDPPTVSMVPGTPVPRSAAKPLPPAKPAKVRAASVQTRGTDPGERRLLGTGMTQAEFVHRVGRPDMRLNSRRKEGTQWSYLPAAGDADTPTTVTFADGTLTGFERKVVR